VENALYTYERFEESAANQFRGGAPIIATVGAFGFDRFPPLGGTQANCFVGFTRFQIGAFDRRRNFSKKSSRR
jgi:hypothetical protein